MDPPFGDVPPRAGIKSPLGHSGLPTELPVSYRQNCFGDRFLLCLQGLMSALAAVRGLASSSGRLSPCFPDDEASYCGCRGPALRAARSRLTALVVSAGHMPGPVGQAGAAASFRLRNAGPAGPCHVSLVW